MIPEKLKNFIGILAVAFTVIPAMILSGFFPEWNVLPFENWVLIATIGTGICTAFLVPRWYKGLLTGAIIALGALYGLYYYVPFRIAFISNSAIFRIEIALAVLIGAIPGVIVLFAWGLKK